MIFTRPRSGVQIGPLDDLGRRLFDALESRGWSVPGVTALFKEAYFSEQPGDSHMRYVAVVTDGEVHIRFSCAYGHRPAQYGLPWVSRVAIRQRMIAWYEDQSGPTYEHHTGKGYDAQAHTEFLRGACHVPRTGPRPWFQYVGVTSKPNGSAPAELVNAPLPEGFDAAAIEQALDSSMRRVHRGIPPSTHMMFGSMTRPSRQPNLRPGDVVLWELEELYRPFRGAIEALIERIQQTPEYTGSPVNLLWDQAQPSVPQGIGDLYCVVSQTFASTLHCSLDRLGTDDAPWYVMGITRSDAYPIGIDSDTLPAEAAREGMAFGLLPDIQSIAEDSEKWIVPSRLPTTAPFPVLVKFVPRHAGHVFVFDAAQSLAADEEYRRLCRGGSNVDDAMSVARDMRLYAYGTAVPLIEYCSGMFVVPVVVVYRPIEAGEVEIYARAQSPR